LSNNANSDYNSKIIIPNLIDHYSEIENQTKQISETDLKVSKEQSEVILKEQNNDETISQSGDQENIEEISFNKSFEKNNQNIGNFKDKHSKELYDSIEVNLSNFEIENVNAKNEFNKFVVYKNNNNQSLNIAKLSTAELIKIINKNSNAYSLNKNLNLKDKEFTYKNQRKKLKNSNPQKKSSMHHSANKLDSNNSALNVKAFNNNSVFESDKDNIIIPFEADVSVNIGENGLHKTAQAEELMMIKEKIGDNVKLNLIIFHLFEMNFI